MANQRANRKETQWERTAWKPSATAISITIVAPEFKVPHDPDFRALIPLWPFS